MEGRLRTSGIVQHERFIVRRDRKTGHYSGDFDVGHIKV